MPGDATASVSDRALGTNVHVVVTRASALAAAKAAVDLVLRDIDDTCSRFRDDSELSRLNARAGTETPVSELLGRAIAAGLRAAALTDGAVDLTVGAALRRAGYDVDFASVAPDGEPLVLAVAPVPGWQAVRYSAVTGTVSTRAGVEIDLGATAKALAADMAAAAALAAAGEGGVLVSLGGDISTAGEPPPGGWSIQVSEDSNDPVAPGAERIAIQSGALASSSTQVRRWRRGTVELNHIIDPRTGAPVQGRWRLVTVAAATCVDANTASTAAIVLGEGAEEWLAARHLPARLVAQDGTVVRVDRWPASEAPAG